MSLRTFGADRKEQRVRLRASRTRVDRKRTPPREARQVRALAWGYCVPRSAQWVHFPVDPTTARPENAPLTKIVKYKEASDALP
jgi:hypothetical protein